MPTIKPIAMSFLVLPLLSSAFFLTGICIVLTAHPAFAADCEDSVKSLSELLGANRSPGETAAGIRDIIKACPELAEAHFQLGTFLLTDSRPEDALKSFQKAVELKRDPLFLVAMGNSYLRLKDFKKASQAYDDALRLNPNSAKALQGLSVVQLEQDKPVEAEDLLRRAIQISSEDASLFYNLGLALLKQARTEEATESLRAAVERRTPYPEAQLQLALAYLKVGSYDAAERELRASALHQPKDPNIWLALASAQEGMKNYPQALASLDKALALDQKCLRCQVSRSILLVKGGKSKDAIQELQSITSSDPKNGFAFSALGWALIQEQKYSEAQQALEAALKIDPRDSFVYNNLGVLWQLQGDEEKAKSAFEHARELAPGMNEAQVNLNALTE